MDISDDTVVVVIRGDDDAMVGALRARAVDDVIAARGLSASDHRSVVENVEEFSEALTVVSTPSMFVPLRVVQLAATVTASQLSELIGLVRAPDAVVVRMSSKARPPQSKAVVVVSAAQPRNDRDRTESVASAAAHAGLRLDRPTVAAISDRLGADLSDLDAVLVALAASPETPSPALVSELVDLGTSSNPFKFIDAMEAGDAAAALEELARLAGPSRWAPLRTLGLLRNRWVSVWRISCGAPVPDTFPGRQQAALARRIGRTSAATALGHVLAAEAAAKGFSADDPQVAVEVAVGRISRLCATGGSRPRGR